MPAKDSYWLLRIGAGAGVLGAVLAGVGNLLHPRRSAGGGTRHRRE